MRTPEGVREIKKGEVYEINFRPYRGAKRQQYRVEASSIQEAATKRAQAIVEANASAHISEDQKKALEAGFVDAWPEIRRNLEADGLEKKTISGYEVTYKRAFGEFRAQKFPTVKVFNHLSTRFFEQYKAYYTVDMGRKFGWRAEITDIKALVQRAKRLGFCEQRVIDELKTISRGKKNKKNYPEIPMSKISELLSCIKRERPDYYPIIYFIYRTGRRVNEATLIEKRDVVFDRLEPIKVNIRAETTKMDEDAPLEPLDKELRQVISIAYRNSKKHKAPFLFLNRLNKKCQKTKVREHLVEASKKLFGYSICGPHYFRHRFLTEAGKKNLPLVDVMAISGLRDSKVLIEYYQHSTSDGRAKVLEETK